MYRKVLRRRLLCICSMVGFSTLAIVCTVAFLFVRSRDAYGGSNSVIIAEQEYDSVSLGSVTAPHFGDEFCTMLLGEQEFKVSWGVGDECVMWYESGYPGFNMPMIVEGELFAEKESVRVRTDYGVFNYRLESSGFAFADGHCLIDLVTEEKVVNFGVSKEKLFLYDRATCHYGVYSKESGTSIVL